MANRLVGSVAAARRRRSSATCSAAAHLPARKACASAGARGSSSPAQPTVTCSLRAVSAAHACVDGKLEAVECVVAAGAKAVVDCLSHGVQLRFPPNQRACMPVAPRYGASGARTGQARGAAGEQLHEAAVAHVRGLGEDDGPPVELCVLPDLTRVSRAGVTDNADEKPQRPLRGRKSRHEYEQRMLRARTRIMLKSSSDTPICRAASCARQFTAVT